jgi:hypothetical protein
MKQRGRVVIVDGLIFHEITNSKEDIREFGIKKGDEFRYRIYPKCMMSYKYGWRYSLWYRRLCDGNKEIYLPVIVNNEKKWTPYFMKLSKDFSV